ncbi:DUF4129 domain-containing protein [Arthrobacter sp. M4]|uniref:DUF4129 domain-containing protein n=1 Tax=Arthrobacter sp. M4 TaxID=218160 RepID=UPI001CDC2E4D|nr:DUF4129 domain-containing protein [Arthrobacter sp. M4]MCA4132287.1 DUF4129 domain-containing protein [Arthrobacter sp. M4]
MNGSWVVASLLHGPAFEPPLDPDRNEAQRWAAEELADPRYQKAAPSWFEDFIRQITEWVQSLFRGDPWAGADVTVPLVAFLGIAVVVTAVLLARPRLNARRAVHKDVFDDGPSVSAEAHRRRAAELAGAGDWAGAVVEQFRAIVRGAEERVVIDPRAGRTADEAAVEIGPAFPLQAEQLRDAAVLFDSVRYGHQPAKAEDHAMIRELDTRLTATTPTHADRPGISPAVPR